MGAGRRRRTYIRRPERTQAEPIRARDHRRPRHTTSHDITTRPARGAFRLMRTERTSSGAPVRTLTPRRRPQRREPASGPPGARTRTPGAEDTASDGGGDRLQARGPRGAPTASSTRWRRGSGGGSPHLTTHYCTTTTTRMTSVKIWSAATSGSVPKTRTSSTRRGGDDSLGRTSS